MRLVGDMTGLAQRLDQVARRLAIVFDDQDAHGDSDSRLPAAFASSAPDDKAGRLRGPPAEVRTVWGATVPVRFSARRPSQPRSKGTPTKRVPFSPCTRKSTASRPRSCAAAMPVSTSATLFTDLRADRDDDVAGLQDPCRPPGSPRRRLATRTPSPSGFGSTVRPSAVKRAGLSSAARAARRARRSPAAAGRSRSGCRA